MNNIYLILETIYFSTLYLLKTLSYTDGAIYLVLFSLAWVLPNWLYFSRRKDLFGIINPAFTPVNGPDQGVYAASADDDNRLKVLIDKLENKPLGSSQEIAFCKKCGARLVQDSSFCSQCGMSIDVNPDLFFSFSDP